MQTLVRIQPKGLITLPKKIRDQLNLSENSHLRISVQGGKVVLDPLQARSFPIRIYTDAEIDQFLKDDKLDPELAKKLDQKFGKSSSPK
mgnify:CR=1 FL=1